MCEECEEFPPQFVAYFNKAGGKYLAAGAESRPQFLGDRHPPGGAGRGHHPAVRL